MRAKQYSFASKQYEMRAKQYSFAPKQYEMRAKQYSFAPFLNSFGTKIWIC
jgi:hypothetical protein